MLLATLINPWGVQLPLHVSGSILKLTRAEFRQGIVEWQPTFQGPIASDIALLAFIVALAWSVVALWKARRQWNTYDLLVLVLLTALALQARRHLAPYAVVVLPIVAMWWSGGRALVSETPAPQRRLTAWLQAGALVAMTALALALLLDVWRGRTQAEYAGVPIDYIGRAELVRNKHATGRLKDKADLEALGEEGIDDENS